MGKRISEDVQWIIIRLSTIMSREDIAMYTGVSQRKIDKVLSTFNKEGTVKATTSQRPHVYASLCDDDVQVRLGCSLSQQASPASNAASAPDDECSTGFIP
jgi:DNA-binding transcriptional regulator LsrR (DeoR family)